MQSARLIGAVAAILGFVASIVAGLGADNAFAAILEHALAAMLLCFVVGYCAGTMVQCVARERATTIAAGVKAAEEQAQAANQSA